MSYQYHLKPLNATEMTVLNRKLSTNYLALDYVEDTYPQYAFGHLTTYGAKYYTYLWSEMLAELLFKQFNQDGVLNPISGLRFRQMILEAGASKPALSLINDYLNEDYTIDELLNNLGDASGGE